MRGGQRGAAAIARGGGRGGRLRASCPCRALACGGTLLCRMDPKGHKQTIRRFADFFLIRVLYLDSPVGAYLLSIRALARDGRSHARQPRRAERCAQQFFGGAAHDLRAQQVARTRARTHARTHARSGAAPAKKEKATENAPRIQVASVELAFRSLPRKPQFAAPRDAQRAAMSNVPWATDNRCD